MDLAIPEHSSELRRLQKILRHYQGFQLIFALYTDPPDYRNRLIDELNRPFKQPALLDVRDLADFAHFEALLTASAQQADVIHIIGLDAWLLGDSLHDYLRGFNFHRESIAEHSPKPLVLWMPEYLTKDFALLAPDCWEWRRAVLDFCYLPEPEISADKSPLSKVFSEQPSPVEQLELPADWSHARFLLEKNRIEESIAQGQLHTAREQAEVLYQTCLMAGTDAYQGADYDSASAHFSLARVLKLQGYAENALTYFQQVLADFETLSAKGDQSAARMVAVTLTGQGDCLRAIGQLETATGLYLQAIERAEKLGDNRQVAVGKTQLATVRLLQKDYSAALAAYAEARELFSELNEPETVAVAWHQTGMVYRRMQDFEAAERCYRESLNIKNQLANQAGIASSLNELGNLYDAWGRLEQAVKFYSQAADIYVQLDDKRYEGLARSNLAYSLIKLQRYDEARSELQRAIECKSAFGHSALPWTTWDILHDLEQACHNPEAAHAAKQQAILSFLAYRRDGGENMYNQELPQLCQAVLQAIRNNNTDQLLKDLPGLEDLEGLPAYLKPVIPKLNAILQGERNPALADDPELDYDDAAELLLLLEAL